MNVFLIGILALVSVAVFCGFIFRVMLPLLNDIYDDLEK